MVGRPGRDHAGGDEREQLTHDLAEDLRRGPDQHADVEPDDVDLVPVHQLPVGDRGLAARHAVDDDTAGDPLGRGQARLERGAARRLQHHVDTRAAGQPQHLGGEVAAARVQDVVGAQREHRLVLVRRRGGDDRRAVVLGHRDRGLTGGARRGVDQHGLPGGDAAQRLERGQRGRPVDDEAQRLLLGPAGAAPASPRPRAAPCTRRTRRPRRRRRGPPAPVRSPPRPPRRSRRRPRTPPGTAAAGRPRTCRGPSR